MCQDIKAFLVKAQGEDRRSDVDHDVDNHKGNGTNDSQPGVGVDTIGLCVHLTVSYTKGITNGAIRVRLLNNKGESKDEQSREERLGNNGNVWTAIFGVSFAKDFAQDAFASHGIEVAYH